MEVRELVNLIPYKKADIRANADIIGAALDSREVKGGNLFFAAKGKNTDGNVYAASALENGAAAVIMDSPALYEKVEGSKLLVENSLISLQRLAHFRISNYRGRKVAVTGSFGKTGVKDMLYSVLKERYNAYATFGNHNNRLGLDLTIAGIPTETEAAVFEIGSNAPGEILELSKFINPDAAIVTGAGFAHIGRFGSLEAAAKEKLSIIDAMREGATLIVNEDLRSYIEKFYPQPHIKVIYFGKRDSSDIYLVHFEANGLKAQAKYSVFGAPF
ncbi:MAG: UDP-N-acetylmuramoyl-tripeptide--D-alanyl-D-alanine ligase, partial [Deferribacteraceae bacterium]|nr:UDP-N-acetylmuramoyl-tripeptide--D-alanyl-D-alanine ligase [Deferribacteraceae bacterium]